jgi:hypothetical protein
MAVAYIDLKNGKEFAPSLVAMVINESFTGCAVVLASDVPLKKDMKIKIKVGNLEPMKAQVAWFKTLEENIHKVGVKLLE